MLNNMERLMVLNVNYEERQMKGFCDALGYNDLVDLGFTCVKMTWSNVVTRSITPF